MRHCPSCSHENPADSRYCNACGFLLDSTCAETKTIAVAVLAPAVEERFAPGAVLAGRYRIVAPLGRGGMGEVYCATDLILGQSIALKFLPQSLSHDARALNRLYNEVRLARRISHPNVCRVYDIAEADGLRFLTMEYVDGEHLGSLLRRIGRLPAEKATEVARRLCAGLAAAHDRGVLHRDLKPANIMIDAQGNVRITDFGLAVLRDALAAEDPGSGTPAYMAPEQLAREQVSIRSDIYSLGLVLLEVFGGPPAFKGGSPAELLRLRRGVKPVALFSGIDVDPQIERAVLHCLEPDPRDRPPSATAVAAELSGGDPLTAMIAAGETPAPELVARAGATEGLPVRFAVVCLSAVIAALIIYALLAPRVSILSRVPVETLDALERVARDTLSSLGIHEGMRHHVAGFSYDIEALRRHFDPAALYLWYRASPYWMVPRELTARITLDDPPADLPGMILTKWDGTGRLLYLKAVPPPNPTSDVTASELWKRLFNAAGLQPAEFKSAQSRWISAPGWDARASWTGVYPDSAHTPVRVEAAAWRGLPVYFEVAPEWRNAAVAPVAITSLRPLSVQLAMLIVVFGASAVLAWRNVHRGRVDRQGAARLAVFLFVVTFVRWACLASHVPDLAEFTSLFLALTGAGFITLEFWTIYMALEPYVRRRWPHTIISWTRILSGKLRDPMVGGHLLIGTTFGAALMALMTMGISLAGAYGLRLPSSWILSGVRGTFALAMQSMLGGVTHGLSLLFFAFFCKVFLRLEWLALVFILPVAFAFEPPSPLAPASVILILIPTGVGLLYLLLHRGLLPVIVAIYTLYTILPLPLTADLSASPAGASMLMLCGLAALACFGFHSTLAGRPLFKLEL
jgi:hypothetical protein